MTRQYQLVLFGATGYTGKLTALYMATNLPTNIKWAIAGRSESKLEALAEECKALNPDRIQPAIEICELNDPDLADLARKTTLLISTVGPYFAHGEHAFKACAENGTNYLDCTGESPWVLNMIQKYETAAKTSGAIMIPQFGIESCPSDITTFALVSLIRKKLSVPTGEVILGVDMHAHVSGGTAATVLGLFDRFSIRELAAASAPYALSPIPGPKSSSSASLLNRIFGIRNVPGLGFLGDSIQAGSDTPIVQRTWGLLGGAKTYGPQFFFAQYSLTSSRLHGLLTRLGLTLATFLLLFSPLRWIGKRLIPQPGNGPSPLEAVNDYVTYTGIAYPDNRTKSPRAWARASFKGSMYEATALILTQGAISLMEDNVVATKFGGGILTPATLGQPFLERLDAAGFKIESRLLDD